MCVAFSVVHCVQTEFVYSPLGMITLTEAGPSLPEQLLQLGKNGPQQKQIATIISSQTMKGSIIMRTKTAGVLIAAASPIVFAFNAAAGCAAFLVGLVVFLAGRLAD